MNPTAAYLFCVLASASLVGCAAAPLTPPPSQLPPAQTQQAQPPHGTPALAQPSLEQPARQQPPLRPRPPSTLLPDAAPPEAAHIPVPEIPIDAPAASEVLPNGLHNPMPGGIVAGYPADTGLDIAGFHKPVYAIAAGTIEYSEPGHTRWAKDDRAVLLRLDEPISFVRSPAYLQAGASVAARTYNITHVWYAHLSVLRFEQSADAPSPRRVEAGELLGISGIANTSPHLHLGFLLGGHTAQRWGSYLLDDECRRALGDWRRGQRLPG